MLGNLILKERIGLKEMDRSIKDILDELAWECDECCGITSDRERVLDLIEELRKKLDVG